MQYEHSYFDYFLKYVRTVLTFTVSKKSTQVVADRGYFCASEMKKVADQGIEVCVPSHCTLPEDPVKNAGKPLSDPFLLKIARFARTSVSQNELIHRKTSVEPVFGILKSVLGFTHFFPSQPCFRPARMGTFDLIVQFEAASRPLD